MTVNKKINCLGADILKLKTSYRGERFQVPNRQTGEYKVDVTRHPKFPLAFGELASGGFPHCLGGHICWRNGTK